MAKTTPWVKEIKVWSACWSCGLDTSKVVDIKFRYHKNFHWNCQWCDVTWEGPGRS